MTYTTETRHSDTGSNNARQKNLAITLMSWCYGQFYGSVSCPVRLATVTWVLNVLITLHTVDRGTSWLLETDLEPWDYPCWAPIHKKSDPVLYFVNFHCSTLRFGKSFRFFVLHIADRHTYIHGYQNMFIPFSERNCTSFEKKKKWKGTDIFCHDCTNTLYAHVLVSAWVEFEKLYPVQF